MAVTTLPQAIHDWWMTWRPGLEVNEGATLRTGLISDLITGDFLVGARATVISTGSTTGGNRTLTLRRRGELEFTVAWAATSTIWFSR